MSTVSKTFRCRSGTARALDGLVRAGRAKRETALPEERVEREIARHDVEREERVRDEAWRAAMKSPAYRAALAEVEADVRRGGCRIRTGDLLRQQRGEAGHACPEPYGRIQDPVLRQVIAAKMLLHLGPQDLSRLELEA